MGVRARTEREGPEKVTTAFGEQEWFKSDG